MTNYITVTGAYSDASELKSALLTPGCVCRKTRYNYIISYPDADTATRALKNAYAWLVYFHLPRNTGTYMKTKRELVFNFSMAELIN